jgi:hypothetical protein
MNRLSAMLLGGFRAVEIQASDDQGRLQLFVSTDEYFKAHHGGPL